MDMSPTDVGYKFRSLALANCPINSNLSVTTNADNTSIFNCLINKMASRKARGTFYFVIRNSSFVIQIPFSGWTRVEPSECREREYAPAWVST